MNDDDLGRAVAASADRRVRALHPRPDVEELFDRVDARATRQRRILTGTVAVVLVAGLAAGFAIGRAGDDSAAPTAVVALDDGTPPRPAARPQIEPADVEAAEAAIGAAFQSAFAGGVPTDEKIAAIQDGEHLRALFDEAQTHARQFGYTKEQLAGTSISLRDIAFIDDSHALAHFTLTIPGHGSVLVDRVGYAVNTGGGWKVALRTECDLLSLSGLGRSCPPVP